ncbi:hypothetical protein ACIA59_10490 [Micromonospora haikouensis]|uniref:hypothetical protein n=1 Tax=Micromonospora haikouensis TaxID=686309 RepID=UPI00378FE576
MSRHLADRHAERGPSGRRQIANPVGVDYLLSPAAAQFVTRTKGAARVSPRSVDAVTAVIPAVPATPWFGPAGPATTGVVLAELRTDLTTPPTDTAKDSPA